MSKSKKILLVLFFLALILRIYRLDGLPNGFYEEEVTNAYVGRFILQTGRDLYGNILPLLYFDKFGDYPPVLPMYLSGLSTFFFGVNEFAARFPFALISALMIFPIYFLTQLILKNKLAGFLSAIFLAVTPWHIVLTRTGAEGIVGLTAIAFSLMWLFSGIENHNRLKLIFAGLGFFLSYFLYPSFRLLVPLIFLPISFFTSHKPTRRWLIIFTIFFFVLTGTISLTTWGKGRFIQTSIFKNQEIQEHSAIQIKALSYGDGPQNKVTRIFHNKVVVYARAFLEQYFGYFSPNYLFLFGGGQHRYYNVPYQGLLLIIFAPLLLFSVIPLSPKPALVAYLTYLLLIAPLPAVLTMDFPPHVHRSLFMILPLIMLAGYGANNLITVFHKPRLILIILGLFLTLETAYFWHQYSTHEAGEQSILRNGGDKELAQYIIKNREQYDKVIVPGFARIPIYYLYFSKNFSPSLIGKIRIELRMDDVDNLEFANDWCPTKYLNFNDLSPKTLIIDRADCERKSELKQINGISRRDSTSAYKILVPK